MKFSVFLCVLTVILCVRDSGCFTTLSLKDRLLPSDCTATALPTTSEGKDSLEPEYAVSTSKTPEPSSTDTIGNLSSEYLASNQTLGTDSHEVASSTANIDTGTVASHSTEYCNKSSVTHRPVKSKNNVNYRTKSKLSGNEELFPTFSTNVECINKHDFILKSHSSTLQNSEGSNTMNMPTTTSSIKGKVIENMLSDTQRNVLSNIFTSSTKATTRKLKHIQEPNNVDQSLIFKSSKDTRPTTQIFSDNSFQIHYSNQSSSFENKTTEKTAKKNSKKESEQPPTTDVSKNTRNNEPSHNWLQPGIATGNPSSTDLLISISTRAKTQSGTSLQVKNQNKPTSRSLPIDSTPTESTQAKQNNNRDEAIIFPDHPSQDLTTSTPLDIRIIIDGPSKHSDCGPQKIYDKIKNICVDKARK